MDKYHKIQGLFKRDEKTRKFIIGEYSIPELEYLKDNEWVFTEKVDGTNIRVDWDLGKIEFGGRTDRAQIPALLFARLQSLFTLSEFEEIFPETPMTLYGEGFGVKIQKGGGNYVPDGVDFVLFDVKIGEWYLKREDIAQIGKTLGIDIVPIVGSGTLNDGIQLVKNKLKSAWGDFEAEGIVLKPVVDLYTRNRKRIITKIKHKDWE